MSGPVVPLAGPREGAVAPDEPGRLPGGRARLALAVAGLLLPVLVVWSVRYPPQLDAPNHVARHFLESLRLRGEPLPPGYEVEYRILPNLGGDVLVPLLMCAVAPWTAWKIFCSLSLLLSWLGPALFLVQQAEDRRAAWCVSLLLLPFVLTSPFFWGYLNYCSGVGLAFLVLIHLVRLERSPSPPARGLALHAVLVTLLFLWHLAAVVLYGAIAGSYVLARAWARRREEGRSLPTLLFALRFALPLLPTIVLFGIYFAASRGVPQEANVWEGPVRKILRMTVLFSGYHGWADLVSWGLWGAAVWAFFGRSLLRPGRHWLLLATGVLLLLYALLPHRWGSTNAADTRVLPAVVVCVLGFLGSLRLRRPGLGLLLVLLSVIVRTGSVAQAWHSIDRRLQALAPSLECLPPECRLLPAPLVPPLSKEHPEWHFACEAVVTKRAFVPTLFAYANQQPLRLTKERAQPWSVRDGAFTVDAAVAERAYDFLWICNTERRELRLPRGWERVYAEGDVSVWRITGPK